MSRPSSPRRVRCLHPRGGRAARPEARRHHAMDSLRIEKAYRHWGHDITPEDTPLEAGLGFCVALDKPGGFIGREALLAGGGKLA